MSAFLIEGKARPSIEGGHSSHVGPRFGFTITKKLGNAVVRNRMRRRFKAALAGLVATHTAPDMDYVIVARRPAFDQDFARLSADLDRALRQVAGGRSVGHRAGDRGTRVIKRANSEAEDR